MMRKEYRLDESDLKIIEEARNEMGLKSDSDAVRYIIRQYGEKKGTGHNIQTAILRQIEERVDLLLDIANTELIERNADQVYPVRMAESPVLSNARKLRRQMLADKKQRSDYGKKKK